MSQKFWYILVRVSSQGVYHVTKSVIAVVGPYCGSKYRGSWFPDILCIAPIQPVTVKIFYPEQHHSEAIWNEHEKLSLLQLQIHQS